MEYDDVTEVGDVEVSVDDVEEIFETSVVNDSVVERLVSTEETWRKLQEIRQHNL